MMFISWQVKITHGISKQAREQQRENSGGVGTRPRRSRAAVKRKELSMLEKKERIKNILVF